MSNPIACLAPALDLLGNCLKILPATGGAVEDLQHPDVYIDYLKKIEAEDRSEVQDRLEPASEPFDPRRLADTLAERGYYISADMLAQAVIATVAAWASGQFVILAGPTGVGKTRLVKQLRLGNHFELETQDNQPLDENDPTLKAMKESARQLGLGLEESE